MNVRRNRRPRRRGIVMVEAAIVLPVVILLILATLIGGLGVFRYQQIAYLAREGSRWASVHGATYQEAQGVPAPSAAEVMTGAQIVAKSGLDPATLTPTVTWNNTDPKSVTFRLTYRWTPQMLSPTNLSSTSTQPITY